MKKKKENYTRFFHVFVFLEHRNGTGIPFLAINLFWKFGFGEGKKKKKNRSEESSTGKNRSKTGMETSIVIKKLATSLSRLIIRIIVVVLSRLRVRSKLFREKKIEKSRIRWSICHALLFHPIPDISFLAHALFPQQLDSLPPLPLVRLSCFRFLIASLPLCLGNPL